MDGLRIELIGSYTDTEFGDFNAVSPGGPLVTVEVDEAAGTFAIIPIQEAFDAFDPFGDVTFGGSGQLRLEFNEVVRAIADIRSDLADNWTLFALGTLEDVNRFIDFSAPSQNISDDRTYSAEVRAHFDYGGLNGWIGAYYFNLEESDSLVFGFKPADIGIPTIPPDASLVITNITQTDTVNYAFFGEVSVFANNLLNDRVITDQNLATVSTATGLPTANGGPLLTVNDPRLFGVEVRAGF